MKGYRVQQYEWPDLCANSVFGIRHASRYCGSTATSTRVFSVERPTIMPTDYFEFLIKRRGELDCGLKGYLAREFAGLTFVVPAYTRMGDPGCPHTSVKKNRRWYRQGGFRFSNRVAPILYNFTTTQRSLYSRDSIRRSFMRNCRQSLPKNVEFAVAGCVVTNKAGKPSTFAATRFHDDKWHRFGRGPNTLYMRDLAGVWRNVSYRGRRPIAGLIVSRKPLDVVTYEL